MGAMLDDHNVLEIIQIVGSVGGMIIAWAVADARSKSRLSQGEEKIRELSASCVAEQHDSDLRLKALEVSQARSETDRIEIRKALEKLDATKASREVVDSFRAELGALKVDIDKRFDKIEDMIRDSK